MSGFKASLFNIHGRQYMGMNMSLWMSRFFYRSAIFNGYADYLSILTIFVSFGLISGSHRVRLMALRCLKQIFTDLLWKRRPPWKPPWNQILRTLQFCLSTNVEKDMEIMDLSWVICTTKTMPSPAVGVGDDCMVCYVTGDDGMRLWLDLIHQRRFFLYLTVMDSYQSVRKKFTISRELFLTTTNEYSFRIVISGVCRSTQEVCVDRHKPETVAIIAVDVFFFSALIWVTEVQRMRTRRSNQQHVWDYSTTTNNHISFVRRVPKSKVLRCNGWIADFDFRKRKRRYIDKQQMFPKLESHTRLTDKTRATKHIFRIAAPNLLCFFVTEIFDCIYILMCILTTFGSY